MSNDIGMAGLGASPLARVLRHELHHLRSHWWWFLLLGSLLVACGTAAIVFPNLTVMTSFAVVILLGALLMVGGVATIVGAFWAGKWSGLIVQLLVGILYLVGGLVVFRHPEISTLALTVWIAASFVVLGLFRVVGSLVLRYPQWGWGVLNGIVTLLAGIIIFKLLPEDAFWVIGLLVGIEMLFNGWTWVMLAIAIRNLPVDDAHAA
jgi:uncharacterized membrane protein HdeD (DUF308 family)